MRIKVIALTFDFPYLRWLTYLTNGQLRWISDGYSYFLKVLEITKQFALYKTLDGKHEATKTAALDNPPPTAACTKHIMNQLSWCTPRHPPLNLNHHRIF